MHIKATCPRCQTTFQVDPGLRGKRMRCPNAICRTIFVVGAEVDAPPAPPAPPVPPPAPPTPTRQSGNVGDLVPILPAEAFDPLTPPAPLAKPAPPPAAPPTKPASPPVEAAPAWHQPPPVRRRPVAPPAQEPPPPEPPAPVPPPPVTTLPVPAPPTPAAPTAPPVPAGLTPDEELAALFDLGVVATPPAEADPAQPPPDPAAGPVELAPGTWDAPPVRAADGVPLPPEQFLPADLGTEYTETHPPRRRWRLIVTLLLFLSIPAMIALFLHLNARAVAGNEEQLYQRARQAYKDRDFLAAAEQFGQLAQNFPDSSRVDEYRFFAELSGVRAPAHALQTDPTEARQTLEWLIKFVEEHRTDALFADQKGELGESFKRMVDELIELAKRDNNRPLLVLAQKVYDFAGKHLVSPSPAAARDVDAAFAAVDRQLKAKELREDTIARLKAYLKQANAAAVRDGRELVEKAGLAADPEVKALHDQLPAAHLAAVRYMPVTSPPLPPALTADSEPGLVVLPLLEGINLGDAPAPRPVLAVARGVLYALEPANGKMRWATRLGSDSTESPLWLPGSAAAPDRVLALSTDAGALVALDARDGRAHWRHALSAPALGQPLLVHDRLLVPLKNGRVEELHAHDGRLLGVYDLGQPLTGACHQPGTDLVYLTGDRYCVYALDAAQRKCTAVLYTKHLTGALCCPPAALSAPEPPRDDGKPPVGRGFLLLCQADDTRSVRLRTFALPPAGPDAEPVMPDQVLQGRPTFPPADLPGRLALVTDAGALLLQGRKQPGSLDSDFFPLYQGKIPGQAAGTDPAQVLYAHGPELWLLVYGQLHLVKATTTPAAGPVWRPAKLPELALGAPLHAAQVAPDEFGRSRVVTVTEAPGGLGCWATALDPHSGGVVWKRQLGLQCRGPLLALGPKVLSLNETGHLLSFDAGRLKDPAATPWQPAGTSLGLVAADLGATPRFLTAADGTEAFVVYSRADLARPPLHVWHYQAKDDSLTDLKITKPLEAALTGTPALAPDALLLPLADGRLYRQSLREDARAEKAIFEIEWRSPQADQQSAGHLVALGGGRYLLTDGSTGIRLLHRSDKEWKDVGKATLPRRITGAPLVLPPGSDKELRVVVADAGGVLTLLHGDGLVKAAAWKLDGPLTLGPFAQGQGFGAVVGAKEMVWFDPDKEEPVWERGFDGAVVGAPRLIDGVLVVADVSGKVHSLDPATGAPVGPGYALRASAAPAATPVPFGAGRLFVPLTDGTVLLLSREYLKKS